ncbi:NADPH-dependent F420 reductase [Bifidobacterium tsurumiense]|uniref:NADPH-dependent F420 reductase n=1 Tax=Bifidobacterium tsurumiense TaxID=356829 RepID=UPI0012B1E3A3|nr:NADPH-dependent F420 reductase [Bifidobacterium tsurumiense]MSS12661.1 NADPH-dependent F420 reductase [Bifidobacterium tsurumiense]
MTNATIFGKGNMGSAIASVFKKAGIESQVLDASTPADTTIEGDIVVLAVPYPALATIADTYGDQLAGKTVVDITNPLDFSTFDSLVTPADGSAAAELQAKLPQAKVLKAFNTNFAATLASGKVGEATTVVQVAGDDDDAKKSLMDVVKAAGLDAIDAGSLKRARELEAFGFLQLALAVREQISFTGGYTITR